MFTEEQQKAIDKVKKLMNLSEGSTSDEEAQTAAMMARSILSKYNLNITDIKAYREETSATELRTELRTRNLPRWVQSLAGTLCAIFDCESIIQRMENATSISFIGVEPNITICSITFDYLYGYLDGLIFPRGCSTYLRNSYRLGFSDGMLKKHLDKKLEETSQSKGSTALVVVQHQLIDDFKRQNYPHLRTVRNKASYVDPSAFNTGFKDGMDFEYRKFLDKNH